MGGTCRHDVYGVKSWHLIKATYQDERRSVITDQFSRRDDKVIDQTERIIAINRRHQDLPLDLSTVRQEVRNHNVGSGRVTRDEDVLFVHVKIEAILVELVFQIVLYPLYDLINPGTRVFGNLQCPGVNYQNPMTSNSFKNLC